jgi:hypothetical protein
MNDILSKLESYLYGEPLPECTSNSQDNINLNDDNGKAEVKDYIYNENGVFSY